MENIPNVSPSMEREKTEYDTQNVEAKITITNLHSFQQFFDRYCLWPQENHENYAPYYFS